MATITPKVAPQLHVVGMAWPAASPTCLMKSTYFGEPLAAAAASHLPMKVALLT